MKFYKNQDIILLVGNTKNIFYTIKVISQFILDSIPLIILLNVFSRNVWSQKILQATNGRIK